jgi:hypothetical protein
MRVAVSNALFRVIWPSPHSGYTNLQAGISWVDIPVIPDRGLVSVPAFTLQPAAAYIEPDDAYTYDAGGYPRSVFVFIELQECNLSDRKRLTIF